jgi:sporulation protein YlmC with PRC-barrel domain
MSAYSLRRTTIHAAALLVLVSLPVLGASQQSANPNGSGHNAPIAGAVPLGVTVAETALVTPGYRASELLHKEVYNDQEQKIGRVGDLVISPDGKLSVAVIDVGGFLGVGKHQVAIPVQQFKQLHPKVVLPGATKQALKALPEFVPA